MVVVAQLVRASDCDSEGRGFEPPRLPTKRSSKKNSFFLPISTSLLLNKQCIPFKVNYQQTGSINFKWLDCNV